ncbi:hypothetical protein [Phaeobacter phage MD18]|nr:hypothetical protein [Phaeobacter phage MD18]
MRDLTLAVVAGLFIGGLINFPWKDYFFPVNPYENVTIHSFEETPKGHVLHASFFKNECEFRKLEAHARSLGEWERLSLSDVGGEKGDRVAGWHTFTLLADTTGANYDDIEFRTRHHCPTDDGGNEVVDRVFYGTSLGTSE